MPRTRKSHPPSLKAKVAVEAIKAHKTTAQIAQILWRLSDAGRLVEARRPTEIFGNGHEHLRQQADAEKDELYKQIGQFKVQVGL